MLKTIALDAMGGDFGPSVVIPAAAQVLKTHPELSLILVGMPESLAPWIKSHLGAFDGRYEVRPATEVVAMDESPALALRTKKDSSMRVAINCVKDGLAQACVSAGNTGALMATAKFVLKTLPGIDRPAIITTFPTRSGKDVFVLDLGANVDSTPENLYQFAVMGSLLAHVAGGRENPRVALLNIGQEEIKGNELVKKSAELLNQSSAINFVGYVEGDQIFTDAVDVIVCDGFVGNVALKAAEGIAKLIARGIKSACMETWWTKLLTLPAVPVLRRMMKRVDPDRSNGATLLGLNGVVVKSHGGAGINAFAHAINVAWLEAEKNVPQLLKEEINRIIENEGSQIS